jgi:hypothetical protein
MCKKLIFLLVTLALCLGSSAQAAKIIWVTQTRDQDADGVQDDLAFEEWLRGLGYEVDVQRDYWMTLDAAKIATLNAADLIILSRSTNSGDYAADAAEVAQWNSVTTPMILTASYIARSNRWQWVNSESVPDLSGPTMNVLVPDHIIFTGVDLGAANQVMLVDGTTGTGQTSFTGTTDVGNGTLIVSADNSTVIAEWEAGTPYYTGSGTPASKRMLFNQGTHESGATPWGAMNLTEVGRAVFANAILYMMGVEINPNRASGPQPEAGQTDVPRDVVLSWMPGETAATHDVYFGTNFVDVNDASRANPLGVLVSQNQTATTLELDQPLAFGTTYYWRVDEVEAGGATIHKGSVWSFEAEPLMYTVSNITATASLPSPEGQDPNRTIDGSGLNGQGQHSAEELDSWQVTPNEGDVVWIQYDFDRVYKLAELQVWNYNFLYEPFLHFGLKDVTIEYAADANDWTVLGEYQLDGAPGLPTYAGQTIDLGGIGARSVRITANSNHGGPKYGLSEVQFQYIPVHAREPEPAAGATGVEVDAVLSWRAGREATSHQVSIDTDEEAVASGSAPVHVAATNSYDPGTLDLGAVYYWKVDEVNEAATPSVWTSGVWNFATQEYISIDDFESYTDDEGTRIYDTWLDGYLDNPNGSLVGHENPPFAEQTVVNSGSQSMPFYYDNTAGVAYSEVELAFPTPQDWTANGADTLSLYHHGIPIGFLVVSDSHIVMNGTGEDIWGTVDQGRFAYKQLTGNGTIVARIESIDNTDGWAKAGVMIRQSLNAGSSWAHAIVSAANGARFQARLTTATDATSDTSLGTLPEEMTGVRAPAWVKLERIGNVFNVYYATDEEGTEWVANPWNPQTITMTDPVFIGVAVTSHNVDAVAQAEFTGIATTGNVTGQWQSASLDVDQPDGNGPDRFYVSVADNSGRMATVANTSPAAIGIGSWKQWLIPLSDLTAEGVNTKSVKRLIIGVGDKSQPSQDAAGLLYIDDIGFGHPAAAK